MALAGSSPSPINNRQDNLRAAHGVVGPVFDAELPAVPLGDDRGAERQRGGLPPVADEKLAAPDRHEDFRFEAVALLPDADPLAGLSAAEPANELAAERGELLPAFDRVFLIGGRIDRGVGLAAEFGALAVGQDVHHVQLVPFRFARAQLVANEIDQQREQDDVSTGT